MQLDMLHANVMTQISAMYSESSKHMTLPT